MAPLRRVRVHSHAPLPSVKAWVPLSPSAPSASRDASLSAVTVNGGSWTVDDLAGEIANVLGLDTTQSFQLQIAGFDLLPSSSVDIIDPENDIVDVVLAAESSSSADEARPKKRARIESEDESSSSSSKGEAAMLGLTFPSGVRFADMHPSQQQLMLLKLSSAKEHELNEDELSILRAQRGLIQMLKKQPHRASDPRLASLLLDEARTLQTLERMVARADENDDDVIIQDSDDEMGLQLAPAAQASSAPAVVASDAPISKASASTAAATAVPAVAAPASSAASSSSDSSDSSDSDSSDSDDSSSDDSDESDSSEDSSSSSEDSDSSDDGPPRAASSKNPLPISVLEPRPLVNGGVIPGEGMKRTQARNRRRRTLDRARRNGQPPSPAVNGKTSTPAKKTGPYADYDEAAPSSAPAKRVTNGAVNGEAAAQRQRRQSAPAAPDAARPSPSTCNQHVVPPSERMHEVPSNLFVTVVDVEKRGWEPGMRTLVESAAPHQPNGTHTNDLVSPTVNGAAEITQWTPEEVDVEWHFLKSLDRAHAKLGMIVAQKILDIDPATFAPTLATKFGELVSFDDTTFTIALDVSCLPAPEEAPEEDSYEGELRTPKLRFGQDVEMQDTAEGSWTSEVKLLRA